MPRHSSATSEELLQVFRVSRDFTPVFEVAFPEAGNLVRIAQGSQEVETLSEQSLWLGEPLLAASMEYEQCNNEGKSRHWSDSIITPKT